MSFGDILGYLWDVLGLIFSVVWRVALAVVVLVLIAAFLRATFLRLAETLRPLLEAAGSRFDGLIQMIAAIADVFNRAAAAVSHFAMHRVGERRSRPLFRTSTEAARTASNSRRNFVSRELRDLARSGEDGGGREVLEVPPTIQASLVLRADPLAPLEAIAQLVRLEDVDRASMAQVLADRVADAVECILRNARASIGESALPGLSYDVALRRLSAREHGDAEFDWAAVVGTSHPDLFRTELERLRDWLGISVELAPPLQMRSQRRCRQHPRVRGTVAGHVATLLKDEPVVMGMTCAHVVPDPCACRVVPEEWPAKCPDAALVSPSGCFQGVPRQPPVTPLARHDVKDLLGRSATREGGYSRPYNGIIQEEVVGWHEPDPKGGAGISHRFAACLVVLDQHEYFWCLKIPLFRRSFTRKGDSGSWVFVARPGEQPLWLGMVQGGGRKGTYVLLAEPLLKYFGRALRRKWQLATKDGVTLIPYLMEKI